MFVAAIIPGLIAVVGYGAAIAVYVRFNPAAGPAGEREGWSDRIQSLQAVWPVALIFVVVIGGMYQGVFTPTEGAAVGAAATGVLSWTVGRHALRRHQGRTARHRARSPA